MKYDNIQKRLLNGILKGDLKPGDRIATRVELMKEFNTSRATVQKAMDLLQSRGVIRCSGKGGTFITDRPPNLYTIAVIFPRSSQDSPEWDSLWSNITNQKSKLENLTDRKIVFYYLDNENPGCAEYERLIDDVSNSWLAGIIYPYPPANDIVNEIKKYDIPQVALTEKEGKDYPEDIVCVWHDYNSFIDKSLDYLKQQGCKKVAMLANAKLPKSYISHFLNEAKTKKMKSDEMWTQAVGLDKYSISWTSNIIKLMMQKGALGRPDALIIANENLAGHTLNTLLQEGIRVGTDITLVMHSNFPSTKADGFDIKRIGFDVKKIIQQCVNSITALRSNNDCEKVVLVPADTEDGV